MGTPPEPSLPSFDPHIVATIVRRELRDNLRDWRIVLPVVLLTLAFPLVMNATSAVVFGFLERYNALVIGERFLPFGVLAVGFFPITFSLVVALEAFVGERERNSLEALFATPASDAELYFGKLIGAFLLPVASSLAGMSIYLAGLWLTRGWLLEPKLLVQIYLLTVLEGLVMVTGAIVVSSHTTSVRAANLLASFIVVPMALLLQVVVLMMFWGTLDALWFVALGLVVVDVILIRAGLQTFNRETILAREIDHVSPRRLLRLWLTSFREAPEPGRRSSAGDWAGFSLRRVYGHDLPVLLWSARLPIVVTSIVLLGGLVTGLVLATVWPLPPALVSMADFKAELFRERLAAGTPGWNLLPEFSAQAVFGHNLRALLLSALLSVLSFGSLALILLMVPMGVIGFLVGQIAMIGEDPLRFLLAFILPHGIVEIPAAILATAFALRLGAVLIAPPTGRSAGEAFLQVTADFVKVFLFLVAPLLLVSALLEVYLTPQIVLMLYG